MRTAFTLIELLVVITIIVLLLSLLTPALDKALQEAEKATCMANLHAVGGAHGLYLSEFKNRFPAITGWHSLMGKTTPIQEQNWPKDNLPNRPLNAYLGYSNDGSETPATSCPSDIGERRFNWVDNVYEAFGTSYGIAWFRYSRIDGVYGNRSYEGEAVSPYYNAGKKRSTLRRTSNKIIVFDWPTHGNRFYAVPEHQWHGDPQRKYSVLFADNHVEFLYTDPVNIEDNNVGYDDNLNQNAPANPSWRWW